MTPSAAHSQREHLQIVDVREPREWAAEHIEGAVHIPLGELPHRLEQLDRARPVVTVCRSGARSAQAATLLRAQGFDVDNLDGGMTEWSRAGLPTTGREGLLRRVFR